MPNEYDMGDLHAKASHSEILKKLQKQLLVKVASVTGEVFKNDKEAMEFIDSLIKVEKSDDLMEWWEEKGNKCTWLFNSLPKPRVTTRFSNLSPIGDYTITVKGTYGL